MKKYGMKKERKRKNPFDDQKKVDLFLRRKATGATFRQLGAECNPPKSAERIRQICAQLQRVTYYRMKKIWELINA